MSNTSIIILVGLVLIGRRFLDLNNELVYTYYDSCLTSRIIAESMSTASMR